MKNVDFPDPLSVNHYQFFKAYFLYHSCTDKNRQGPQKQLAGPCCRAELRNNVMFNLCYRVVLKTPDYDDWEGKTVTSGEF